MNRENVAAWVMVLCPLNESVIYVDQECIAGWVVTWATVMIRRGDEETAGGEVRTVDRNGQANCCE
jgi:hypothetical protein